VSDDGDALLDDQLRYYDRRAPIYDDAYTHTGHNDRGPEANARWFAELAVVEAALDRARLTGDVLELGCGTGRWTERLASTARTVTALDGAPGMLDVARQRLAGTDTVRFELVDVIRAWHPATDAYDAMAAFFFLEHVTDDHLDGVLANVARALRPGAAVFVAEGLQREEHRERQDDVEHRHLPGHEHLGDFQVVERRRSADELTAAFAAHGISVTVAATDRLFCIVTGSA
jgi:demethylmenaquinone methyltransferase/2-methoxy-6-polyprenyl-1,4-benzoquinol methylase